jgi:hypothetical protein
VRGEKAYTVGNGKVIMEFEEAENDKKRKRQKRNQKPSIEGTKRTLGNKKIGPARPNDGDDDDDDDEDDDEDVGDEEFYEYDLGDGFTGGDASSSAPNNKQDKAQNQTGVEGAVTVSSNLDVDVNVDGDGWDDVDDVVVSTTRKRARKAVIIDDCDDDDDDDDDDGDEM